MLCFGNFLFALRNPCERQSSSGSLLVTRDIQTALDAASHCHPATAHLLNKKGRGCFELFLVSAVDGGLRRKGKVAIWAAEGTANKDVFLHGGVVFGNTSVQKDAESKEEHEAVM